MLLFYFNLSYKLVDMFHLLWTDFLRQHRHFIVLLSRDIGHGDPERVLGVKTVILIYSGGGTCQIFDHVILWFDPRLFQDVISHLLWGGDFR
jgi:hypothetical protein